MNKSKVYYTNLRVKPGDSLLMKLERLIRAAGIDTIDFAGKFTAIKIHFGEPGNLAYLRPNYAKAVADVVKSLGGKPFLTDCNTLYVGARKDALEHMESAYTNGFSPFSTGCHIIIADGLKGTDEVYVPVKGGEYVKEAKIGRAVMDADVFLTLSHFKGHECTGFGGALKNIGMGCGSRAGKMEMHSAGKPHVIKSCVSAAKNVLKSVLMMLRNLRTSKLPLTMISVSAVAVVLVSVLRMLSVPPQMNPMTSSTVKLPNIPKLSSKIALIFTSISSST